MTMNTPEETIGDRIAKNAPHTAESQIAWLIDTAIADAVAAEQQKWSDGLAVIEDGRDALTLRPTYWARYAVDGFGSTHTDHDPVVAAHRAVVDAVRWAGMTRENDQ